MGRGAVLLVLVAIGILSRARYFNQCIHDDAFISFRYARNLVRGAGLVMNPGERVEGYTNFLWTLLAATPIQLDLDPATVAQLLGAGLSLVLVVGAWWFTERRLGGGWYALVTPVFLVGNMAYAVESLSGLESMAFAALLFATYVAFLEERRGTRIAPGLWAALAAAATLVRPEGALLFALLAVYATVGVVRGEPPARLRKPAVMYLALVAPLFIWRLAYYQSWLPNTFYAKVGFTAAQVARGWRFTINHFAYTTTWALLLVVGLMTVLALARPVPPVLTENRQRTPSQSARSRRLLAGRPRDEALGVGLLLAGAFVLYILLLGGDYEPTNRLCMPVLPILYLLFQEGLRTFVLFLRTPHRSVRTAALLIVLTSGTGCLWVSEQRFLGVLRERNWPRSRFLHHRQLCAVGEWLEKNTAPGTTVAVSSIGALAWHADRPIIDMMGLTDRHIARRKMPDMGKGAPGHEKGDGAYVLMRRPEIIVFDKGHLFPQAVGVDKVLEGARGVSELEIARSVDLARDYELRLAATPAGVLHLFVRRANRGSGPVDEPPGSSAPP